MSNTGQTLIYIFRKHIVIVVCITLNFRSDTEISQRKLSFYFLSAKTRGKRAKIEGSHIVGYPKRRQNPADGGITTRHRGTSHRAALGAQLPPANVQVSPSTRIAHRKVLDDRKAITETAKQKLTSGRTTENVTRILEMHKKKICAATPSKAYRDGSLRQIIQLPTRHNSALCTRLSSTLKWPIQ